MSVNPGNLIPRLRACFDPLVQTLPPSVMLDLLGSLSAATWCNLLAEGRPVPQVVANLSGRTGRELEELTTRVLYADFKNRCLAHTWHLGGLEPVVSMIQSPDAERLKQMHEQRQPAVFVFSHFGPRYAIGPAFQSVNVPIAMFQGRLPAPLKQADVERFAARVPGTDNYWINDTNRAVCLKRAVERLQRGGLVACAIDGTHGEVLTDAEFLGHRIQVAKGPAVLARMTGVPLIPITVTWNEGWSMAFRVFDPIAVPDTVTRQSPEYDQTLTTGAVKFFDQFLRSAPEQLRLDRIAKLITLPKVQ